MSKTYRLVEEIANVGIKSIDVLRITILKLKILLLSIEIAIQVYQYLSLT